MKHFFTTAIGRLRLLGYFEGISLLVLVCVAVPLKYCWNNASLSQVVGPVHGALFLLFIFNVLSMGVAKHWNFKQTTWKVLIACVIPFGTFYIDHTILSKIDD